MSDLAQRLRVTREATGLSQSDFARRAGITPQQWNNYEQDRERISINVALKLCQAFGVTTDWIYRGQLSSGVPFDLTLAIQQQLEKSDDRSA